MHRCRGLTLQHLCGTQFNYTITKSFELVEIVLEEEWLEIKKKNLATNTLESFVADL